MYSQNNHAQLGESLPPPPPTPFSNLCLRVCSCYNWNRLGRYIVKIKMQNNSYRTRNYVESSVILMCHPVVLVVDNNAYRIQYHQCHIHHHFSCNASNDVFSITIIAMSKVHYAPSQLLQCQKYPVLYHYSCNAKSTLFSITIVAMASIAYSPSQQLQCHKYRILHQNSFNSRNTVTRNTVFAMPKVFYSPSQQL